METQAITELDRSKEQNVPGRELAFKLDFLKSWASAKEKSKYVQEESPADASRGCHGHGSLEEKGEFHMSTERQVGL